MWYGLPVNLKCVRDFLPAPHSDFSILQTHMPLDE